MMIGGNGIRMAPHSTFTRPSSDVVHTKLAAAVFRGETEEEEEKEGGN